MGSQAGQIYLQNRGSFVSKITVRSLAFLIGISAKKDIKQYVFPQNISLCSGQVAKSSPERHYIPNWNFMLIRRTILFVTCQPGISLLWSSSSYKISMRRSWYSKLEIYAKDKKMMTSWFFWLELFDLMFRIIAGNCLIDLKLLLIFYPILDHDLLHKNGNKLITD